VANRPSLPGYPAARADATNIRRACLRHPKGLPEGAIQRHFGAAIGESRVTHAQSAIDEVRKVEPAQAPPSLLSLSYRELTAAGARDALLCRPTLAESGVTAGRAASTVLKIEPRHRVWSRSVAACPKR
jgi:hypothetical protein